MALNPGDILPIEFNEMLGLMRDRAQEKGVSMKEYLRQYLNVPEEEAPLLYEAVSHLDKFMNNAEAELAEVDAAPPTTGGRRSRKNKNRNKKNKSRRGRR